jgi:hypothetical protein
MGGGIEKSAGLRIRIVLVVLAIRADVNNNNSIHGNIMAKIYVFPYADLRRKKLLLCSFRLISFLSTRRYIWFWLS